MRQRRPDAAGTIDVVIVSYNAREHLRACLGSVLAQTTGEIVVADNGSTDGSADMVGKDFPTVALLVDPSNPGYGAAANAAIAACGAPYVLLLNSDTLLRPHALEALAGYLDENPTAALVGPRLVNLDGSVQRSCYEFPTPLMLLLTYSYLGDLLRYIPACVPFRGALPMIGCGWCHG